MTSLLLLWLLASPPVAPVPDISGTWEVRTTPGPLELCDTPASTAIYNWVVTVSNGAVDVQVTTETAFKKMSGTLADERLFVVTPRGKGMAFFEVTLDPKSMTFEGRRGYFSAGCFIEYTATGRKL